MDSTNRQSVVFARVKRNDRHHMRYDVRDAAIVDTADLAFTHTDRNLTLTGACKAFGIAIEEERPGKHSGDITPENLLGNLWDTRKTAQLFWALVAEHSKHPIALHPSRAQSGATLAKAYLDAMGIQPRLTLQPELKPQTGESAQAYFGGWCEAAIPATPLPCVYVDLLSAFPSVFALLGLWWDHVIPERLEVEEIPPQEIVDLLSQLRDDPDRLFDPAVWRKLGFFALVKPNGATLPARVDVPSGLPSRRERIAEETTRRFDEESIAQAAFWAALDECSGRIVPDMLFDPRRKRWIIAGEFVDIPHALLRKNSRRSASGKVHGNIDQITQVVRDALGDPGVTTSNVLDFFRMHERPTLRSARAQARAAIDPEEERRRASNAVVSIGPVESGTPLWHAGPDLAHAAIAGTTSEVVRAWRIKPHGTQPTLKPILFRGVDLVDPQRDDFFKRLIELRKAKTGDPLDDERRSTGYKVVANSGAYGCFAETNPIDVDPSDANRKPRPVTVYADEVFTAEVDRPERPGRMTFFPTAALVTAGARLMLGLGRHLVKRAGGEIAYCDTDSLVIVASEHGGYVPCENGPYVPPDGGRAVRALSWDEVEAIRNRFASLNPFDQSTKEVRGPILQLEKQNFRCGKRVDLYFYGVTEKSYALFTLSAQGEPIIRKYSSHVLGQYRSPIKGSRHRWMIQAWKREIRAALGFPVEPFPWEDYPAIALLSLSTWKVLKPYLRAGKVGPFDFVAVATISRNLADVAERPYVCCKEPRPACMPFDDVATWREQEWCCLNCGEPWDFDAYPRLRTYGDLIRSTLQGTERKRLNADGSEVTRGLTISRPVHVESKTLIGKEVIVDPTDTVEGLTAEQLSATSVTVYEPLG